MKNGFRDRAEAGRELAARLREYASKDPIVLALPRGGVPIAAEVARALAAELDVWVVRKIGVPWHRELGMGAVAEGGHVHVNREIVDSLGISEEQVKRATDAERREVEARVSRFRGDRPGPAVRGRVVVLVDDGIATGGTVRAAIRSLRALEPRELVLAVPVAAEQTVRELVPEVDRLVCCLSSPDLGAIGEWYADFDQVPDGVVVDLLEGARKARAAARSVAP